MDEDTAKDMGGATVSFGFTGDVARYLKAFLETGLRANLRPSRQVTSRRINGLPTQLYLDAYPQLNKNLYKNFTAGLAQEVFVVSQNKYVKHVDERLSEGLAQAITSVDKQQISRIIDALAHNIDAARITHHQDADSYREAAAAAIYQVLSVELLVPIVRSGYGQVAIDSQEAHKALVATATSKVFGLLEPALQTISSEYFAQTQSFDSLSTSLKDAISLPVVRTALDEFLEDFTTTDAYLELYNLHLGNQSLEHSEMYLYFGEVGFRDMQFPVFYTPLRSSHAYPSVTLNFENRIFVNVRALQYVLQEYAKTMGQDIAFPDTIPAVIEIDTANRKDILLELQSVIDSLIEVFDIDMPLNLDSALEQSAGSLGITLNNRLQVVVFNKANDSLIQDYIDLIAQPKSKAGVALNELLTAYALGSPLRYVQEVNEEWDAKTLNEKLVTTSLVPLNDEQKQVSMALAKHDANVVVVDGAPGTGKSHLAAALVAQACVDGQTALVLSRTPTALTTIQNTVSASLREVRGDHAYHTPLLHLNQSVEGVLEELEQQYLDKLTAYHQTYTKLQSELVTAKNRKIKEANDILNTTLQSIENINLQEVEQTVANEARFGGRDWVREEPIDEISPMVQSLHQAIAYIRGSEANYLLPYIEQSQQKAIGEFIGAIREYEKANNNVHQRVPQFVVRFRKLLPEQKAALQGSLSYIHSNYRQYVHILADDAITSPLAITDSSTFSTVLQQQAVLEKLIDLAKDTKRFVRGDKTRSTALITQLISYNATPDEVVSAFTNYIEQVISLKSKIFGFSGRTLVVENLTKQLKKALPEFDLEEPEKRLDDLQLMVDVAEFLMEQLAALGLPEKAWKQVLQLLLAEPSRIKEVQKIIASFVEPAVFEFMADYRIHEADNLLANVSLLDYATQLNDVLKANPGLATLFGIKSIGQVLAQPQLFRSRFDKLATDLDDVKQLDEAKQIIKDFIKTYPQAAKRLGINYANGNLDVINDGFAETSLDDVKEYLNYKKKEQDITQYFKAMTTDDFSRIINDLRQMSATQLSHSLDSRALAFVEQQAEEFTQIKQLLRSRQRFSEKSLKSLQQLFPIVFADVRDYASYVPLGRDLFDLLIIDEASCVSIAEALPAMLRAKKVVVIGDGDTLVNEAAARIDGSVNDMYLGRILSSFSTSLRNMPADTKNQLTKRLGETLNARNSALGFTRPIANSEVHLTQYARSSAPLMSYVNKQYYHESLKCVRARTLPLPESIRFDQVKTATDATFGLHINLGEAKHIIEVLTQLREDGFDGTIGIITPFYEQASLIQRELDECVISDWFAQRQLKVMTFDTSRGHERDYVFYSLVATPGFDTYDYLLREQSEDRAAKRQQEQLSNAFATARETIHFVHSKPLTQFSGVMQQILQQYQSLLTTPAVRSGSVSDILMAAESLFPQYFYATKFYKKYGDKARLVTQFSLGDLLKPFMPDRAYPAYKVNFLIAYGDARIVITYDEFKEQFLSGYAKNTELYTNYVTEDGIYYQKLLEGYGYRFLNFNKFNLGAKPVDTLDSYLADLTKQHSWPRDNGFLG